MGREVFLVDGHEVPKQGVANAGLGIEEAKMARRCRIGARRADLRQMCVPRPPVVIDRPADSRKEKVRTSVYGVQYERKQARLRANKK